MKKPHALLLGLVAAACASDIESNTTYTLNVGRLPQAVSGPCSSAPADSSEFKNEVDSLQLAVSGPGMRKISRTFSVRDEIVMDKIPEGEGRVVAVSGMKGALALWRGAARDVKIQSGKTTDVSMLLTRISDLTCGRNAMTTGRSFHSATPLPDGRILIAGGITSMTAISDVNNCARDAQSCQTMTATAAADIFDPVTGEFFATGEMNHARAFHTAVPLRDGRVLIVGGVSAAVLNRYMNAPPFPLQFADANAVPSIEVFDPATDSFEEVGNEPNGGVQSRTFAAGIQLDDGRVIVTGGGTPEVFPAGNKDPTMNPDYYKAIATKTSVECDVDNGTVVCSAGPEMIEPRVGHVLIKTEGSPPNAGKVMAYGGVVGTGTVPNDSGEQRNRQGPEFYDGNFWEFDKNRPAYVNDSDWANNVFFGSALRVKGLPGPLIAGGLIRADGMGEMRFLDPQANPTQQVWFVDENDWWMAIGIQDAGENVTFALNAPRFFAQAAPFGDGSKWVVAGGFEDLNMTVPSDAMEFFDSRKPAPNFTRITVSGNPRGLRQRRGGPTVVALPNKIAAAIVGGMTSDGSAISQLDTVEIITDNTEPTP